MIGTKPEANESEGIELSCVHCDMDEDEAKLYECNLVQIRAERGVPTFCVCSECVRDIMVGDQDIAVLLSAEWTSEYSKQGDKCWLCYCELAHVKVQSESCRKMLCRNNGWKVGKTDADGQTRQYDFCAQCIAAVFSCDFLKA